MEFLKKIYGVARERPKRVVFPEADEPRIAEAMARLGAEGICEPLVLGDVTEAQVQALVMARGMKEVMARRLLAEAAIPCGSHGGRRRGGRHGCGGRQPDTAGDRGGGDGHWTS